MADKCKNRMTLDDFNALKDIGDGILTGSIDKDGNVIAEETSILRNDPNCDFDPHLQELLREPLLVEN